MYRYMLIIALIVLCSACNDSTKPNNLSESDHTTEKAAMKESEIATSKTDNKDAAMEESITLSGKLVYQQHEGGFFGFISDSGEKYTLRGLDKSYRKNGIKLVVSGKPMKGMMTITQFGTVFEVKEVIKADTSSVAPAADEM